jgi:hypothetical protein
VANSFLSRWSQRKLTNEQIDAQSEQESAAVSQPDQANEQIEPNERAEAEVAQAQEPISVAALLTSEAEQAVKKAALRKLFLSGEFSEVDRLNDYDHDYQSVGSLSTEVAEKLRDWMSEGPEEASTLENADEVAGLSQSDEPAEAANREELTEEESSKLGQNIPHNS